MTSTNPENPAPKDRPTQHTGGDAEKETSHSPVPSPSTPASEPKLPPSPNHCKVTCKTEKDWWDKTKPCLELIGIVLLFIYTIFTVRMYYANKKAAEAAESAAKTANDTLRLSAAELAVVDFIPEIKINPTPKTYFWVHYKLVIKNVGNVAAHNITVNPQEGSFGEHTPLPERPDFAPSPSGDAPPGVPTSLGPKDTFTFDWDSGVPNEQRKSDPYWTFWIKVTVGYDDLFGKRQPMVYCMRYLSYKGEHWKWAPCGRY